MATDATDKKIRHEERMRDFAATLNEKDRRRFAALEASERGHGGIAYIANVLGCSTKTIERGIAEWDSLQDDPAAGRVRREGAGRKKIDSDRFTVPKGASSRKFIVPGLRPRFPKLG